MKLTHNTNYEVIAEGFLLVAFTNEALKKQIEQIGFTNVQVNGAGTRRTATGHWPHATQTKEFPSAVNKIIKKVEAI